MKMFEKVVIIGTGMIGGSVGLAVKKRNLASQVIGLSRRLKNAKIAQKIGAIDSASDNLDSVKDADLVVLATPVDSIIELAARIKKKIKKDCIVIDVGSTKEKIVSSITQIIPNFVGCHPLAGSEKRGIANLDEDIFKGSICLITPAKETDKRALDKVKRFWLKLEAKVVLISSEKHDRVLAFTSHLPHTIAFALMTAIPEKFINLSSGGLRDVTRISGSDPGLWSQIFLSNRKNLLSSMSAFQKEFSALKLGLEKKDKAFLARVLKKANRKREKLG